MHIYIERESCGLVNLRVQAQRSLKFPKVAASRNEQQEGIHKGSAAPLVAPVYQFPSQAPPNGPNCTSDSEAAAARNARKLHYLATSTRAQAYLAVGTPQPHSTAPLHSPAALSRKRKRELQDNGARVRSCTVRTPSANYPAIFARSRVLAERFASLWMPLPATAAPDGR
jgi:hypothetical protein